MIILLFLCCIGIALFQYVCLGTAFLWTAVAVVCAAAGTVFWLVCGRKKVRKLVRTAAAAVCVLLSGASIALSGGTGRGELSYEDMLKNDPVYEETVALLADGEYEAAQEVLNGISDRTSALFYAVQEQIYRMEASEDAVEKLCGLYLEAAGQWPDWTYMQKNAGIAQIEQGNYKSAGYYLERVAVQNESDAQTWYYLGVADYYLSDYETAKNCFEKALELELDADYDNDIIWYVRQMEQEAAYE